MQRPSGAWKIKSSNLGWGIEIKESSNLLRGFELRNKMEERINFKNARGLNLAGILYPSENKKIIILVHGWCSNKDRKRFLKLANKLHDEGFGFLRFDQSSSGESEGDEVTVENLIDDVKSAIEFVKSGGYKEIGLIGESLGGLTTLSILDDSIKARILFAPVTASKTTDLEEYEGLMKDKGYFMKEKDGNKFKIPKKYLEERKAVNQKELLSKIKIPILILHGDNDDKVPLETSQEAIKFLPKGSKLEVIKGAGHDLEEDYEKVIKITIEWFNKHLDYSPTDMEKNEN